MSRPGSLEVTRATCVGPVTAAPFEMWGVPTIQPERARLAAMVKTLEIELPRRREGMLLEVAGCRLLLRVDVVYVDGVWRRTCRLRRCPCCRRLP